MPEKERLYATNRHSCYVLEYHLVVITKYRHPVLVGKVEERLKEISKRLIEENYGGKAIRMECDKDHIHVLMSLPPQVAPSAFVNSYKTVTARLLRKEFMEELKPYYWKDMLWSRSYFIGSVSNRTDEAVQRYIADQKSVSNQAKRKRV